MPQTARIVLAGGRSSRMGSPKASLPWHGSTLLRRVTGIIARCVDGPVVVVAARGQRLPELALGVEVVEDEENYRGPLEGLAGGLAAAYRTELLGAVYDLIAAGQMKPAFLFERCRVRRIDSDELLRDPALAKLDPALDSVANLNERADYERALALPAPELAQRSGARCRVHRLAVGHDRPPGRRRPFGQRRVAVDLRRIRLPIISSRSHIAAAGANTIPVSKR